MSINGGQYKVDIDPDDRCFIERECLETLRSLWRIIPSQKWLNHPTKILIANNKIDQLNIASKMGLKIPNTIVVSNLKRAECFYFCNKNNIVAKAIKHGFYRRRNSTIVAPTRKIKDGHFDTQFPFAKEPILYQEEIKKRFDLRVTVIGNDVFSAAIHSQENSTTKIDWRICSSESDFNLRHTRFNLPVDIANRCINLKNSFGLKYSAIDMVYTTEKEFYFLELNPNGQWAWIEQLISCTAPH